MLNCLTIFQRFPGRFIFGNKFSISPSIRGTVTHNPPLKEGFRLPGSEFDESHKSRLEKPLIGVRILDLTRVLAGPYATMLLGDLGAEVIKVERPEMGDDTRHWGPPFVNDKDSIYFLSVNRNKKSICIDIKDPAGANLVKELAMKSDILLENFVPGNLSKYGLGYNEIKEVAPHLVYCSISGFGQTGPYSKRLGYDAIAAGIGGMLHITGPMGSEEPCGVGVPVIDLCTGILAFGSCMAGLLHRRKTGKGQHLDVNLLSTQISLLSYLGANWLLAGKEAKKWGAGHESIVPYQSFHTKDGNIIVGAGNNKQFYHLCHILGMPELVDDERFKTNSTRVINRVALVNKLNACFMKYTTKDWLEKFKGVAFPYGPVNTVKEVFEDVQVLHNDMIENVNHPDHGSLRIPGCPIRSSAYVTREPQRPPPGLGQHTRDVLFSVLGVNDARLNELEQDKIIS